MLLKLCKALPKSSRPTLVVSLISTQGSIIEKELAEYTDVVFLDLDSSVLNFFKIFRLCKIIKHETIVSWMYHADFLTIIVWLLNGGNNSILWNIRNGKMPPFKSNIFLNILVRLLGIVSRFVPKWIICCSEASKSEHIRLGYDAKIISVIPNMTDTRFKLIKPLIMTKDIYLISLIARFDYQKNIDGAIRCVAHLKHSYNKRVILRLAGDGMEISNENLRLLVEENGVEDCVQCLGFREDVGALIESSDVILLPSRYGEGFPNILLESLQFGKIAVTSLNGDGKLLYSDPFFWLEETGPKFMAQRLNTILDHIEKKPSYIEGLLVELQMGLDEYSPNHVAKQYSSLINQHNAN